MRRVTVQGSVPYYDPLRIAHLMATCFFNFLLKTQKDGRISPENDDHFLLKKRAFIVQLAAAQAKGSDAGARL